MPSRRIHWRALLASRGLMATCWVAGLVALSVVCLAVLRPLESLAAATEAAPGAGTASATAAAPAATSSAPSPAGSPPVFALRVQGGIGPATADYVQRGLQRARERGAQLVVLQMDTPGGLDTSMREIIKVVLDSPLPVAGFVAPQGARAASAGTYLLYACHVAAMAPATNLGAATPIEIGIPTPGGEPGAPAPAPVPRAPPQAPANEPPASSAASSPGAAATPAPGPTTPPSNADARAAKRLNDAAAYIRSLAQLRSRNAAWAERAVRESVSLSAEEALAERVIDFVAADLPDLLRKLDGRTLRVGARDVTLATAAAAVIPHDPDWRGRLLAVISDPSVALVLMMLGVYGLLFEFMNPGFVAPGVIGGVCLLLALFALQLLPINYAGLALILLGIAFLVAEAFMPSFGVLGLGGVAAFAFGALMLIDSDVPGLGIPRALVAALTLVSAAAVFGIAAMAAKARRRPVVSGHLALAGATGEVVEVAVAGREGWARIHGEQWRVRSQADLVAGQRVRVTRADGLTLDVAPLDEGRSA